MRTEKILIGEILMNNDRADGGQGDIDSLARNMEKYGQINAVTVVEDISNSYRYRIIAGRRRIAAAESLGWAEIRADVYGADEIGEDSEEMIALSENAAREEMNAIDEGVLYAKELKKGTPVEELAALFCRNKSTVYQRAKLALLIPEMRELYKSGKMSLHVAAMAAALPEEAQKDITDLVGSGWVSEWGIKRAVSNASNDTISQLGVCADCVNCKKRTHYSDKSLFPELADSDDRCLDHECYCKKLSARLEQAFNEFSEKTKGMPVVDCWDCKRIVTTETLPDGMKVFDIPLGEIADDEDDITEEENEKDAAIKEKLEGDGKVEFVPCWDGTEFSFIELAKRDDVDALYYGEDGKKDSASEDGWTQKQKAKMADIFRAVGEDWRKENLSETGTFYQLERKATEIFNEKMRSAVSAGNDEKILVSEQIALITLLYCSENEIRESLPEAGITEDDKPYSLSLYEKLLAVERGAILRALLKSFLSGYKTKPNIDGLNESDWTKIFAHLDIDLTALRDEAAKETAGVKSDEADTSLQNSDETPPEKAKPEATASPAEESGNDTEDDDGLDEHPSDYGDDGDDYGEPTGDEGEYEHDPMFYEEED